MKPYYEHAGITIYHGDCEDVLPLLSVADLVVTDPPYGLNEDGGDKQRYGPGRTHFSTPKHESMGWDSERPSRLCWDVVLRSGREFIVFGGNYFADILPPSPGWLFWDKRIGGDFSDGELIYTSRRMGLRMWSGHAFIGLRGGKNRSHPTQKPEQLVLWCIGYFPDATTILDPFMGSGTTLVAAKRLGKQAVGIEREERYCEIAAQRLQQEALDFSQAMEEPPSINAGDPVEGIVADGSTRAQ